MASSIDPTDVPVIETRDLALALRMLLSGGRVLAAAARFSESELRSIEQAFWSRARACRSSKTAVLLRLRGLVGVFATQRLRALLERYGAAVVPHALAIAATMRLNSKWGFNPQKFARALEAAIAAAAPAPLIATA
jgi:hypothetical protein